MSDTVSSANAESCSVIEELLPAYDDDGLSDSARELVDRHLTSCQRCTQTLADMRESIAASRADRSEEPQEEHASYAVPAVLPVGSRQWWGSRAGLIAIVLALIVGPGVAIAGSRLLFDGSSDARHAVPFARPVPPVPAAPPAPPARPLAVVPQVAPLIKSGNTIAKLTRVGDDEIRSAGFTLTRPIRLQVYALGEGSGGQMHDYAWLMNMETRRPVWAMRYSDTEHAGGASKNRQVNQVLPLERGSYLLYYVTDGSHSYEDWNSRAPSDPESWGVTVATLESRDRRAVREYKPRTDRNMIAQIVGVRDDAHAHQPFELRRETTIRVYAIGEGSGNQMYDYAWITDGDSRRLVWQMRYNETEHAGGAQKNRMIDGVLTLPAGKYILNYATDGSHSFEEWNSTPPMDPYSWGVTLTRQR